jgi:hypothetical protein
VQEETTSDDRSDDHDATLSDVLERVAASYEEARPVLWLGIIGLALAAVC